MLLLIIKTQQDLCYKNRVKTSNFPHDVNSVWRKFRPSKYNRQNVFNKWCCCWNDRFIVFCCQRAER